ncbi:MAG: lipase family protein [Candidatus Omnitrophica bacterium]|nr:lipase family protein [Candidatus Omnitrophota bacterium]
MPQYNFNSDSKGLDLTNALYLAQLSQLAYQPLGQISGQLKTQYNLPQYQFFDVQETDTHVFLAANEKMIVLAFRGTQSIENWLMDFKTALVPSKVGKIHYGFNEALKSVWNNLYETICAWKGQAQTLWVTGHSLGGALAALTVDWLTEQDVNVDGLYTYGQPRVGDKDFANNFNTKTNGYVFRFVNDADIVPRVPPPPGYKHTEAVCFLDNKGNIHRNKFFLNWFFSYSEDVAIGSTDGYKRQHPGGIDDHDLNYYIKYVYQNLQKQQGGLTTFEEYINS